MAYYGNTKITQQANIFKMSLLSDSECSKFEQSLNQTVEVINIYISRRTNKLPLLVSCVVDSISSFIFTHIQPTLMIIFIFV